MIHILSALELKCNDTMFVNLIHCCFIEPFYLRLRYCNVNAKLSESIKCLLLLLFEEICVEWKDEKDIAC